MAVKQKRPAVDNSKIILGGRSRVNKEPEQLSFGVGQSSLGSIVLAASSEGIVSILIGNDTEEMIQDLRRRFPAADLVRDDGRTRKWVSRVIQFIETPTKRLDVPLDMRGSSFEKRVWKALLDIPTGTTTTYTDIARDIGSPKAIRAVGNACSNNNLAVAVPCHRVLHKDLTLTGNYRWGKERQHTLLEREANSNT